MNNMQININARNMLGALSKMKAVFPETTHRLAVELAQLTKLKGITGIIPVRTGNLRSTARVETEGRSVKFITGGIMGSGNPALMVNYAGYCNDGTSRQSPQFFMERSLNAASSDFNSLAVKAINSWLKELK